MRAPDFARTVKASNFETQSPKYMHNFFFSLFTKSFRINSVQTMPMKILTKSEET